jgi:hypothetical protein
MGCANSNLCGNVNHYSEEYNEEEHIRICLPNSPALYYRANGPLCSLPSTFDPFNAVSRLSNAVDDDDDDDHDDDDLQLSIRRVICKRFGLDMKGESRDCPRNRETLIRLPLSTNKKKEVLVLYVLSVRTAPYEKDKKKRTRTRTRLSSYSTMEERDAELHNMQFAWKERQPNETSIRVKSSHQNRLSTSKRLLGKDRQKWLDPRNAVGSGIINHDNEITPCTFSWDQLQPHEPHEPQEPHEPHEPHEPQEPQLYLDISIEDMINDEHHADFNGRVTLPMIHLLKKQTEAKRLPVIDDWYPIHNHDGFSRGRMIGAARIIFGRIVVNEKEHNLLLKENSKRRIIRNRPYSHSVNRLTGDSEEEEEEEEEEEGSRGDSVYKKRQISEEPEEIVTTSKHSIELIDEISKSIGKKA